MSDARGVPLSFNLNIGEDAFVSRFEFTISGAPYLALGPDTLPAVLTIGTYRYELSDWHSHASRIESKVTGIYYFSPKE